MGVFAKSPECQDLRQILRRSTDEAHRRLDGTLGSLDLCHPPSYAAFLQIQYAAHRSVEAWLDTHCPMPLRPPAQSDLIADDLADLGLSPARAVGGALVAPVEGALGVAWVIAGSSLGNRVLLGRIRNSDASVPIAFLSDRAMQDFFVRLRAELSRPALDDRAAASVTAASAVFALFSRTAKRLLPNIEKAA